MSLKHYLSMVGGRRPVVLIDGDGTVMSADPPFRSLLGFSEVEAVAFLKENSDEVFMVEEDGGPLPMYTLLATTRPMRVVNNEITAIDSEPTFEGHLVEVCALLKVAKGVSDS